MTSLGLGGPWALDSTATINRDSYLFATGLSESNVQQWISLAKSGGFEHQSTAETDWCSSFGHYAPNPTLYPDGLAGMEFLLPPEIHAAGLKFGIHTYGNYISNN